jgi:hypothetical protein
VRPRGDDEIRCRIVWVLNDFIQFKDFYIEFDLNKKRKQNQELSKVLVDQNHQRWIMMNCLQLIRCLIVIKYNFVHKNVNK